MTDKNIQGAKLVKDIVRNPYAFPGGYEKLAITGDGACLCSACITANFKNALHSTLFGYRDGWDVQAVDLTCNSDGPITCDHCSKELNADSE